MKRNIRQNIQIAASVEDINKRVPALKETEVVKFAYHVMASDFRKKVIGAEIWDELLKRDYQDGKKKIDFPESRGCTFEDDDWDCVVVGKNDPDNTWAYLKRDGVSRAPLALITKLVLYYTRGKLIEEDNRRATANVPAISAARRDTTMEKRMALLMKIMNLMQQFDEKTVDKLARIEMIVDEK